MTTATIRCGTCRDRHTTVAEVRDCAAEYYEYQADSYGEIYAEAVMSWVHGGGSPEDASIYANAIASGRGWNPGARPAGEEEEDHEECEHGLSASLCDGPNHYPMDTHDD